MDINRDCRRILVVEVNWLGDVLFSTPFIKAVRKKFKNAYIACLTAPRTIEVLERNPHINEIILYDETEEHRSVLGKVRLILSLKKKKFDAAILLHRSFTKACIAYLAGIKIRIGYVTEKRRAILTYPIEPPEVPLHKVDYFLRIASSIGCDISDKNYEFFIAEKEKKYINKKLSEGGVGENDFVVLMNPGANWPPKRWSEENFARLSDLLIANYGVKVVISGAVKDRERAERIKELMKERALNLAGKTNLKQLGALAERANVVISGDTGPMHIAVAMKSNVIALFGPTSPALTGPYGSGNYKVIQKDVGCEIPCYEVECNNRKCMDAITVEDVAAVFEDMYRKCRK